MAVIAPSEKNIQDACLQWLNSVPRVTAWRQNTGAAVAQYTTRSGEHKRRFIRFGERGQSDISGLAHGIRLEIEIKKPKEKPTILQEQWMAMIRANDGISFWCDSIDSCVLQLRGEFQRRNWSWNPGWEL